MNDTNDMSNDELQACGQQCRHTLDSLVYALAYLAAGSVDAVLGDFAGKVAIYCDSRYHPGTRTSSHGYTFDWDSDGHVRYLKALAQIPATSTAVLVSGYRHGSYDAGLSGWIRRPVPRLRIQRRSRRETEIATDD